MIPAPIVPVALPHVQPVTQVRPFLSTTAVIVIQSVQPAVFSQALQLVKVTKFFELLLINFLKAVQLGVKIVQALPIVRLVRLEDISTRICAIIPVLLEPMETLLSIVNVKNIFGGLYITSIDLACVSPCKTCGTETICRSCVSSFLFYDGSQCLESCPFGYYPNNGNCTGKKIKLSGIKEFF